ncbi:30S ribosomal protein S12 methylthiotransferase RimO [Raineyella sp. LH-20]|uniref:30S ribosomal protein S12 methylthiotransferase RimO n=1 Tax=Raineyella sp. LH-20 TaxID=3081204 RepID=UPI002954A502|nr:30S ribosomal protein S12 methylthiotransferase RimO [Raineyella sp. LH-20]WOP20277.1 30S ribosomal protein S12 methylthiotransferase RimO [Raineyella sp. LH-20]
MSVHLVSLGCARNDVDSEELAGRLAAGGFRLVDDAEGADAVMVNTCGFITQAKQESVEVLLEAADLKAEGRTKAVVAVGCMAERYGADLAAELPEADILGFDDYDDIAARLQGILQGARPTPHVPRDRRELLPITPVERQAAAAGIVVPGVTHADAAAPASGPRTFHRRLSGAPSAPLKIASGCDRRCAFCAIPSFRGSYVSRTLDDVVAEARWLASQGVREAFLVSENTSSYGKDLGAGHDLEALLRELSRIDELPWIRVSYLQPAEIRPGLVETMARLDTVVDYFDLSFQHAAPDVLRRMRRFGDPESFLDLIGRVRAAAPQAGIRANVIAGFPGETERDVELLADFLRAARLDVCGVFPYSDEEGTEGVRLDGHLPEDEIEDRRAMLADLVMEVMEDRAADRVGDEITVLLEGRDEEDGSWVGRAAHQGPEVDGVTSLDLSAPDGPDGESYAVGDLVRARVTDAEGIDLVARPLAGLR